MDIELMNEIYEIGKSGAVERNYYRDEKELLDLVEGYFASSKMSEFDKHFVRSIVRSAFVIGENNGANNPYC